MRARRLVALISTAALVVALLPGVALGAHPDRTRGGGPEPTPVAPSVNTVYIVQMAERPVVAYTGDIAGYQATRPARGQKIDPAGADALAKEIQSKLLTVTDPETGDKVFNKIYTRDVFHGAAEADAPDLQLGYADGYQTGKASAAGAAPQELLEINDDKWSGEHASSDAESTPGVFFCNRKVTGDPAIVDLGPTALQYLGLKIPADYDGKPLPQE